MSTLIATIPNLVAEVSEALASEGRNDLCKQLATSIIDRYTYDATADAGYIYLVRPASSPHFLKLGAPIAETIPFMEVGFNIDVDHDGHIFGIEILSRADFFATMRAENAL